MQQLQIRLNLPNPFLSDHALRKRFHDRVKTTVSKLYSKASCFQALRSGLETPIWTLNCKVQLRAAVTLRYAKETFKKGLTECFQGILPPEELNNIKAAQAFKAMEFCEDSEPFDDHTSWWRDEGNQQNQSADCDISTVSRDSISNMGVPEGGRADDLTSPVPSTSPENGHGSVASSPSVGAASMEQLRDAGTAAREGNALSSVAGSAAKRPGRKRKRTQENEPETYPEHGGQLGQAQLSSSFASTEQPFQGVPFGATAASEPSKGWGVRFSVRFRTPNAVTPVTQATLMLKKSICAWVRTQRQGCILEARIVEGGTIEGFIDGIHDANVDGPEVKNRICNQLRSALHNTKRTYVKTRESWVLSIQFSVQVVGLHAQPEAAVHARIALRRQGFERWYTTRPAQNLQPTTGTPALSATKTLAPETPALTATEIPALHAVVRSLGEEVLLLDEKFRSSRCPQNSAECFEIALNALRVVHGFLVQFQGQVAADCGNGGTSERCTPSSSAPRTDPPAGQCSSLCLGTRLLTVCVPVFFLSVNLLSHSCLTVLRVLHEYICLGSNFPGPRSE